MTAQEAFLILQAWYANGSEYITYLNIYQALYHIFLPGQTLWWSERLPILDELARLASMSDNSLAMAAYITVSNY